MSKGQGKVNPFDAWTGRERRSWKDSCECHCQIKGSKPKLALHSNALCTRTATNRAKLGTKERGAKKV